MLLNERKEHERHLSRRTALLKTARSAGDGFRGLNNLHLNARLLTHRAKQLVRVAVNGGWRARAALLLTAGGGALCA